MKKAKWLSALLAVLMLISMFSCIVLPAAADTPTLETYTGDYTIEYKTQITSNLASLIFAGYTGSATDYFFIQMNVGDSKIKINHFHSDKSTHSYSYDIGGTVTNVADKTGTFHEDSQVAYALDNNTEYTVKAAITGIGTANATVTLSLNGTVLFSLTDPELTTPGIGFRHSYGSSDAAYYDDLTITAADGTVLYQNDFSTTENPFGFGEIKDGRFYLNAADEGASVDTAFTFADLAPDPEDVAFAKNYSGNYTIEYDVRIEQGNPGLAFGDTNTSKFSFAVIAQNNNAITLCDFNSGLKGNTPTADANKWPGTNPIAYNTVYSVNIAVTTGTSATMTVSDGTTTHSVTTESDFAYAGLGFRHLDGKKAQAYYDNIVVTAADGTVIFEEDFSVGNPFSAGTIVDGWLYPSDTSAELTLCQPIWQLVENQKAYADQLPEIRNLFDKENTFAGLILKPGTESANADYVTSDYIAVQPGDVLTFGPCADSSIQGYQLAAFDADKAATPTGNCWIMTASCTTVETLSDGRLILSYTIPEDSAIRYIRAVVRVGNEDEYLLTINRPFTEAERFAFFETGDATGIVNLYNFFHTNNNIFNRDGTLMAMTDANKYQYCTSYDFIPVTAGKTLYYGPLPSQGYHFAAYDAEKAPIAGSCWGKGTEYIKIDDTYSIYSYTVPEGTAYVKMLVNTAVADEFLLTEDRAFTNGDRKAYFALNPLEDQTGLFFGDSICIATQDTTMGQGWPYRIARKYGLISTNAGVSGSSFSTARDPNRIINQIKKYSANDYDYVLLHGGVNDAWNAFPVGEVAEGFTLAEFDIDTYAGGLEEAIYHTVKYYGDTAAIAYLFNFNAANCNIGNIDDMGPYFEVAREICAKWGIEYCDLWSNPKVTQEMKLEEAAAATTGGGTYLGNDSNPTDFIHPNAAGYDILAPYIGQFMTTMTPYDNEWFLEEERRVYAAEAAALDRSYFTADSLALFDAAIATAATAADYRAAIAMLEQGDKLIPLSLLQSEYYQGQTNYSVSTAKEFRNLATYTGSGAITADMVIYQTGNIDLAEYPNIFIGTDEVPFPATYDGQSFTISNLKNTPKGTSTALFRAMSGTLRNVTFKDATVENGGWAAMLVYTVVGTDVLLENVHIVDSSYTNVSSSNGAAFFVYGGSGTNRYAIRNCTITGSTMYLKNTTTTGVTNAGLFSAITYDCPHVFENCYAYDNTIEVSGSGVWGNVGFIIGAGTGATLTACGEANNELILKDAATVTNAGAFIGYFSNATLTECYTDKASFSGNANTVDATKNFAAVPATELADGTLNTKLKAVSGRGWEQNAVAGIPMNNTNPATRIEVTTAPTKTEYLEGVGALDLTGGKLTVTYQNTTAAEIALADATVTGFDASVPGEQTLTVSYNGLETTLKVTVLAKSLSGIEITQKPEKLTYLEGEPFDPSGMVVTAKYDNNTTAAVTNYTVSGYTATPGPKVITVTYQGKTAQFNVMVIAKSLSGIEITAKPEKLTYEIGEELDLTGLKVTAKYNNNTSGVVTGYTVSGKTDKAGEQTVTVTFEGKKATFKITVLEALPFKDVKKGDWFYPGVLYSYRAGLMNGTSATTFAPKMNMTRAQMVMILYNLEGQPSVKGMKNPFKDVPTGKWYTNAVVWAANEGLVYGTSTTTFAPDLELSRSQLVTILFRYAQEKGLDNGARDNLKGFADKATVPSWALEATQWAVANKIVSGIPSGNKLNVAPLTVATRSQVATILKGFLDK